MTIYQKLKKSGINLSAVGLEQRDDGAAYFCTPKGARVIGWAGVDGIHYCFIRGFREMVFAVSPMNPAPHYVHPLARDFADFLRLLLACGDCGVMEQAWQWSADRFAAFLAENPTTEEQEAVLAQIRQQTGLSPMENPWQYLRELQADFDYNKIKYPEEYYDLTVNIDDPQQEAEWKVTFEGGFWGHCGRERAGKEVIVQAEFNWAGHHWLIPSVYLCSKGLVVDFCMRAERSDLQTFVEKWNLKGENDAVCSVSQERQMQMDLDNPLHLEFHSILHLNGKDLESSHGFGAAYIPCLWPEYPMEREGKEIVDHYGLDPDAGWMILRASYPWATKRKPEIRSLSVTMIQDADAVPGPHFRVSHPGDTVVFSRDGQEYRLTVQEYEAQTMDWSGMCDVGMEYPTHYVAMTYTVTPELSGVSIVDCDDGDRPRQTPPPPDQPEATSGAMVMGVIGGGDGPVAIAFGRDKQGPLHAACSSPYFAPVEQVEWRMVFYQKQFENGRVDLIS